MVAGRPAFGLLRQSDVFVAASVALGALYTVTLELGRCVPISRIRYKSFCFSDLNLFISVFFRKFHDIGIFGLAGRSSPSRCFCVRSCFSIDLPRYQHSGSIAVVNLGAGKLVENTGNTLLGAVYWPLVHGVWRGAVSRFGCCTRWLWGWERERERDEIPPKRAEERV